MQILAVAFPQRLIGGIADQGVLEMEVCIRRLAPANQQSRIREPFQPRIKIVHSYRRALVRDQRLQQGIGEFASDRRAQLGDLLGVFETVQACHQQVLYCRRDRELQCRGRFASRA